MPAEYERAVFWRSTRTQGILAGGLQVQKHCAKSIGQVAQGLLVYGSVIYFLKSFSLFM